MRSFLRLQNRKIVLPIRTFHSSAKLNARPRDDKGRPLFTAEDVDRAFRLGYENAGGVWKDAKGDAKSNAKAGGKYTEADLKAAHDKGMDQADKYIGGAIRKVWDDGFAHGKLAEIKEEQAISEQRIREERAQNELQTRRLVEEAKNASYSAGLAANPDLIKAKKEGQVAGEIEGRQQAEKKAEEKIANLTKASDEKLAKVLQEAAENEKYAEEQILKRYRYSKKLSTRLQNAISSIAIWGNRLSEKLKPANYQSLFLNRLYQIPKKVGEIPLTPVTSKVYRPSKHPKPDSEVIGWSGNSRSFNQSQRYLFKFDIDKLRIKDLYRSKIIRDNTEASFIGLKLRLLLALGSIAFVAELLQAENEASIHGETLDQFSSRKNINRLCETLNVRTPEFYSTTAFTADEEEKIEKSKQDCQAAESYLKEMDKIMKARRGSGLGNQRFFGPRALVGVYADKPTRIDVPLYEKILGIESSIRTRVASENFEKAQRKLKELQDLKEEQYKAILASDEQPSNGLRR